MSECNMKSMVYVSDLTTRYSKCSKCLEFWILITKEYTFRIFTTQYRNENSNSNKTTLHSITLT